MPFDRRTACQSPTGATLNLYARMAEGTPRGVVQINHGLAEHAGRYGDFADVLAARGFAVYAHDHRGHGLTRAADAPAGRFAARDGAAKVVADVAAVHDLIAAEHPGLPVIVFGHSMGALVALAFLARHSPRVHAAAIWNPTISSPVEARLALLVLSWERFRLGSDVPSRLVPRLTFHAWARSVPDARTPFDWLSRDSAEVDKYIADPLCGFDPSISLWRDIFAFVLTAASDRSFAGVRRALPHHLAGGDRDPSTGNGAAVARLAARLRRMGFSNLVSTIYEGARHESLKELNRETIMRDFAGWAETTLAASP